MRTSVMNALIHPVHVLTLIVAVVAGLIAAWWLFPLGLLFWIGMVLHYLSDPVVRFKQKMDERQPLASRFNVPFNQIQRIQVQIFNNIAPAAPGKRKTLQPILDSVDLLVEEVYQLCLRMTPVENYQKVSNALSDLELQFKEVNAQIDKATDPAARKDYEEARDAISLRITQQKQTGAQLERIDAYIAGLTNDLNAILGQVISLQTLRGEQMQQKSSAVLAKIQQEIQEVKSFANL